MESGLRWDYPRYTPEDQLVVSYNPVLLSVWEAHLNVQKFKSSSGFAAYLVKYLTKMEPTVMVRSTAVVKSSEVKKYLDSRVISSPEAVLYMIGKATGMYH